MIDYENMAESAAENILLTQCRNGSLRYGCMMIMRMRGDKRRVLDASFFDPRLFAEGSSWKEVLFAIDLARASE